jgi:hypothetical protein
MSALAGWKVYCDTPSKRARELEETARGRTPKESGKNNRRGDCGSQERRGWRVNSKAAGLYIFLGIFRNFEF